MAFTLISSGGNVTDAAAVEMWGSTVARTISIGDIVTCGWGQTVSAVGDQANGTSNFHTFGVATTALAASSYNVVKVIPINPGQLWLADCASNTTTAMLGLRHTLASAGKVTNSVTDVRTSAAIFLAYSMAGAATDKKLIGELLSSRGGWSVGS